MPLEIGWRRSAGALSGAPLPLDTAALELGYRAWTWTLAVPRQDSIAKASRNWSMPSASCVRDFFGRGQGVRRGLAFVGGNKHFPVSLSSRSFLILLTWQLSPAAVEQRIGNGIAGEAILQTDQSNTDETAKANVGQIHRL